jgi:hypothetical protein
MSIYDQKLNTRQFDYKCGKCGGSDYYVAAQVMSQGRTNTFTKNVEIAICKVCDTQMLSSAKTSLKVAQILLIITFVIVVVGFFTAAAISTIG